MFRLGAKGLIALAAGAGASAAGLVAADPPAKPWYAVFSSGEAKKETAAPPARPIPVGPLSPEILADSLKAEQDAYLRRLDVCTKLRTVAVETNDEKLTAEADRLEQQATALYYQRVARLGVKGGPRGGVRTPAEVLDAKLGATADPRKPGESSAGTARLAPRGGGK